MNIYIHFDNSTWSSALPIIRGSLSKAFGLGETDQKVITAVRAMEYLMNAFGICNALNLSYVPNDLENVVDNTEGRLDRMSKEEVQRRISERKSRKLFLEGKIQVLGNVDTVKVKIEECWRLSIGFVAKNQYVEMLQYVEESAKSKIQGGSVVQTGLRYQCEERFNRRFFASGGRWVIDASGYLAAREMDLLSRESFDKLVSIRQEEFQKKQGSVQGQCISGQEQCIGWYQFLSQRYQSISEELPFCSDLFRLQALESEVKKLHGSFQDLKEENIRLGKPVEMHYQMEEDLEKIREPFTGLKDQIFAKRNCENVRMSYRDINLQMDKMLQSNMLGGLENVKLQLSQLKTSMQFLKNQQPLLNQTEVQSMISIDQQIQTLENKLTLCQERSNRPVVQQEQLMTQKYVPTTGGYRQMDSIRTEGFHTNTSPVTYQSRPLNQHADGTQTEIIGREYLSYK